MQPAAAPPQIAAPLPTPPRRRLRGYGTRLGIVGFLLPGLGAYLLLLLLPSLASVGIALLQWSGLSPNFTFVGLENLDRLIRDPVLLVAMANALRSIFLAALIQVPLGLLLGYLLSRRVRGGRVFVFFYFLPVILAEATLAV